MERVAIVAVLKLTRAAHVGARGEAHGVDDDEGREAAGTAPGLLRAASGSDLSSRTLAHHARGIRQVDNDIEYTEICDAA